mmetsp:Transcript_16819/g.48894  ORF Transcript_16819/g.48894 Transcript_16819/m.48894 type:complete len:1597 (+) Transcript_16819:77-4867(+)
MRRTALFAIALDVLSVASATQGSLPSATSRECFRPALSEDEDVAPGLGLIQRALWSKSRETRLGATVANSTRPACREDFLDFGPLPLGYRAELEVFRHVGLVSGRQRPCPTTTQAPSLLSYIAGRTIQERNKAALILAAVWFAVMTFMIGWSIISVLVVPRKREWEVNTTQRKLHLADEDQAFKRGLMHWMSLTWVDGLMGRYGKCLQAVVNDAEIVENRNDEEFTPYVRFKKYWKEQVDKHGIDKASIPWALFQVVGLRATVCLVAAVAVELVFSMVGMVIALDKFLRYLEELAATYETQPDKPVDFLEPTLIIIGLLFGIPFCFRGASIIAALLDGYYCNMCASGLACIVFEKALLLPVGEAVDEENDGKGALHADTAEANKKPSVAQILNVDIIELWASLLKQVLQCMMAPIVAAILLVMLIQQLKLAGFIGVLYTIPCMALTICMQLVMITFWKRYQGFQDVRLKCLTETVLHIRTIKSLAWESLSFERLNNARIAELQCNQKTITTSGVVLSLLHTTPWFSMLIALYMVLRSQGEIPAHQIIVVQRLMMSLLAALSLVQLGVRKCAQAPNSFRRIRMFLAQPERPEGVVREPPPSLPGAPPPPALRAKGSFTFAQGKPASLRDLDVSIPKGELVAVVGEVASGKSSFLQTLMGELHPVGPSFVEAPTGPNEMAYCAQVPWIFEGTLKDNIIMRASFDEERYHKALHAAALLPDLQILPGGDQVTIGSYGVRLSGGQRARVSLARAAYMERAQVLVFDDPFASVDVPTGLHLLDELLLGPLTEGKTRVVVTQPSARLRKFDRVVLMKDGRVVANATPEEVMETSAYMSLLATGDDDDDSAQHAQTAGGGAIGNALSLNGKTTQRTSSPPEATSLREVEAQEHVTWATIRWWIQAAGYSNLFFFVGMVISQRMLMLRESLSLAMWIDVKTTQPTCDDHAFMRVVACYVFATIVSITVAAFAASRVSISASTKMHETVVKAILRAPIDRFFDKQPVGRLINRLSFDMRQVDDYIPISCVMLFMFCFGFCVNQTFVISVMPTKVVLVGLPFYCAVFLFIFLYRGTCVPLVFHSKFAMSQLQDMQAVVLSTSMSIRANNMFDYFMMRYNHQSASIIRCQYLTFYVCKAWVQSRVFLTFCTLTTVFALGGLWTRMPMGTLATVLTLSFEQMVEFESISTIFTQFLNILNALQRLTNYFRIPQEAAAEMPGDPVIRLRATIDRAFMPRLELRRGAEAEACLLSPGAAEKLKLRVGKHVPVVVCHKGVPVLRTTEDNLALELVPGTKLLDVFPNCAELQALQGVSPMYHIVAVNGVTKDAERMAEELSNPPAKVWLDMWYSSYVSGMRVSLEDLTAGYGKDKSVLDTIRVDIPARCKVGFAGKTGCGKSTTLLCILRILEPRSGRILIGDIDSSRIGLNTLRSIVGLVPQDPTIFQGTWRHNIDPFNEFPDGRIWEALQIVQLLPYIRTLPGGIDSEIARDGGNISFGQRQLLSLARMVIRQPPVLLLDECTSALDPSTQQVAQSTLLHDFPMSTVVAIAHRVETILDFDRIVVFDKGSVAEQGTVQEVLSIENGLFKAMVRGTRGHAVTDAVIDPVPV